MSGTERKYKYVQEDRDDKDRLIAKGTLKRGLMIEGKPHKAFVLRESDTGDLLDAENTAPINTALNFNAAVLVRQLVSIDDYSGPVTLGMLRGLKSIDFAILREAQAELDLAGEIEQ